MSNSSSSPMMDVDGGDGGDSSNANMLSPVSNRIATSNSNNDGDSAMQSSPLQQQQQQQQSMLSPNNGESNLSPPPSTSSSNSNPHIRNYFSLARERHQQQQQQTTAAGSTSPGHPNIEVEVSPDPPVGIPTTSSSSSSSSHSPASSPTDRATNGSNKRHINAVLNHTQNHRLSAPSPPKSPIRNNSPSFESNNGNANMNGMSSSRSPSGSPLRMQSQESCGSPTRSPLRIPSRDPVTGQPINNGGVYSSPIRSASNSSSSTMSPTMLNGNSVVHQSGCPSSPSTPTRKRRPSSANSPSALAMQASFRSPPPRSPISAFYFPGGAPASPATRLQHQSTVLQLSLQYPRGFDGDAIEHLTLSMLKLPRYMAPYVWEHCLYIQQRRSELKHMVEEKRGALRRQFNERQKKRAEQRRNRSSTSDMNIDSLAIAGSETNSRSSEQGSSSAQQAGNSSDAIDSSSRNTSMQQNTSSDMRSDEILPEDEDDMHPHGAAANQWDEDEELVLPNTFMYYFRNYLEKHKDTNTRLFMVLRGDVDFLLDPVRPPILKSASPGETTSDSSASPNVTTPLSARALSFQELEPAALSGGYAAAGLPPLHLPSPRSAISNLSPLPVPAGPAPQPNPQDFVTREHFQRLMEGILLMHPGLAFLQSTPEFQMKYAQTCIARIFYTIDLRGLNRITLSELKKSSLLSELNQLEVVDDINQSVQFFSYHHFYVLFCRFWELDSPDHDGYLSLANLYDYDNSALSQKICKRIVSQCPGINADDTTMNSSGTASKLDASAEDFDAPRMDYMHFIPFFLSEVDKSTPQALRYWFRLLDIDHDNVLSLFELDYFFTDQIHAIQEMSTDTIRFQDIVCQCLDMIKQGGHGFHDKHVAGSHEAHAAAATSAATSGAHIKGLLHTHAGTTPAGIHRAHSEPMEQQPTVPTLDASCLQFEFSSCHITAKDLARSHLQSYFFNLLFNLPRFLTNESRDPVKSRIEHENDEKGISQWEAFAAVMYQSLVANDELQARALEQQALSQKQLGESMEDGQQQCEEEEVELMDDDITDSRHLTQHSHSHQRDEEMQQETDLDEDAAADAILKHAQGATLLNRKVNQPKPQESEELASSNASSELNAETRDFLQNRFQANQPFTSIQLDSNSHRFLVRDEEDSPPSPHEVKQPQMAPSVNEVYRQPQQQRFRQEEKDYLQLQRKIHSSPEKQEAELKQLAEEEEDEDNERASPSASSRPISIRPVTSDAVTNDADQSVASSSSVSPPYVTSAAPRNSSLFMQAGEVTVGKENALPLSPSNPASQSEHTSNFKRQLKFGEPSRNSEKDPLSPSRINIVHSRV